MSEIDGTKFGINKISFKEAPKPSAEPAIENNEETAPQITDFSNSKAEALGRSMLFKANDSVSNDLKALAENPQIAENSDKIFETAYKIAQENGIENPYEAAAVASTTEM